MFTLKSLIPSQPSQLQIQPQPPQSQQQKLVHFTHNTIIPPQPQPPPPPTIPIPSAIKTSLPPSELPPKLHSQVLGPAVTATPPPTASTSPNKPIFFAEDPYLTQSESESSDSEQSDFSDENPQPSFSEGLFDRDEWSRVNSSLSWRWDWLQLQLTEAAKANEVYKQNFRDSHSTKKPIKVLSPKTLLKTPGPFISAHFLHNNNINNNNNSDNKDNNNGTNNNNVNDNNISNSSDNAVNNNDNAINDNDSNLGQHHNQQQQQICGCARTFGLTRLPKNRKINRRSVVTSLYMKDLDTKRFHPLFTIKTPFYGRFKPPPPPPPPPAGSQQYDRRGLSGSSGSHGHHYGGGISPPQTVMLSSSGDRGGRTARRYTILSHHNDKNLGGWASGGGGHHGRAMASASPRLSRHQPGGASSPLSSSFQGPGMKRKGSLYGSVGGSSLYRKRSSLSYNSLEELYSQDVFAQPLDKVPKRDEIETPIWTIVEIDTDHINNLDINKDKDLNSNNVINNINDVNNNNNNNFNNINNSIINNNENQNNKITSPQSLPILSTSLESLSTSIESQTVPESSTPLKESKFCDSCLSDDDESSDSDGESFAAFKNKLFTDDTFYAKLHSEKEAEEREYYYERLKADHRYPRNKLKEMKDSIEDLKKPENLKTYEATIIPEPECTWEYQGKLMEEWKAANLAENNNNDSNDVKKEEEEGEDEDDGVMGGNGEAYDEFGYNDDADDGGDNDSDDASGDDSDDSDGGGDDYVADDNDDDDFVVPVKSHKGSGSSHRKRVKKNRVLDYNPSNVDYSVEWEIVRKTELLGSGTRKPTMFYLRCTNSKK